MSDEKLNLENLSLKQSQNLLNKKEKTLENYTALVSQISLLKKEIIQIKNHIAELENEKIKNEISIKWLKNGVMTPSEIRKFLEIGVQLSGKIEGLDIAEVVMAVQAVSHKRKAEGKTGIYDETDIINEEIAENAEKIEIKSATGGTFSSQKSEENSAE